MPQGKDLTILPDRGSASSSLPRGMHFNWYVWSNKDKRRKKMEKDMDSEGRLEDGDGFQFVVHKKDGSRAWFRDHDDLASVTARLDALVKECSADGSTPPRFAFSGAREAEENEQGQPIMGPLRGKGWIYYQQIVGIAYSPARSDQPSEQAMEAATALLEVQSSALRQLQGDVQGMQGAGAGAEGDGRSAEDRAKDMIG